MSKNPSLTQQISLLGQPDAASAHSDGVCKEIPQLVWGNSLTGRVLGCSSHPAAEGQHQTCQPAPQAGLCFPPPAEDSHFRKHLMASTLIFPAARDKGCHGCAYNFDIFFFSNHLRKHLVREQLEMIVLSTVGSAGSLQNTAIVPRV